jgi:hypothetical protein
MQNTYIGPNLPPNMSKEVIHNIETHLQSQDHTLKKSHQPFPSHYHPESDITPCKTRKVKMTASPGFQMVTMNNPSLGLLGF